MNSQIKKCTKSQAESIKRIQQLDMKNSQHVVKQKKKNQEENKSRQREKITDKDWADFSASKMKIKWHLQRAEGK